MLCITRFPIVVAYATTIGKPSLPDSQTDSTTFPTKFPTKGGQFAIGHLPLAIGHCEALIGLLRPLLDFQHPVEIFAGDFIFRVDAERGFEMRRGLLQISFSQ